MITSVNARFVHQRQYGVFKVSSKCTIALVFTMFGSVAKLRC